MMNWNEILSLSESDLFTIGAHTMTHPILSRLSHDDASFEIISSKSVLEDKIGKSVDYFAYPNGRVEDIGDFAPSIVAASGYKAACTMNPGLNDSNADVFGLKRINVDMEMSIDVDGKFSPDLFDFYLSGFLQRCLKWKE
jgi:peptidoglycan/xylan/chitin deacetylase (PgdA/CDA1 family)